MSKIGDIPLRTSGFLFHYSYQVDRGQLIATVIEFEIIEIDKSNTCHRFVSAKLVLLFII